MALFPKIDSPCPLRWKEMPSAERNFCTLCQRKVHNLDRMTAAQRRDFLASCSGEVCVAYTVPRRRSALPSAAGLGLAAALSLSPALAAESPAAMSPVQGSTQALIPAAPKADCDTAEEPKEVVGYTESMGSIRNPQAAQLVLEPLDSDQPELPVVAADAFLDTAEFVAAPEPSPR